MFLEKLNHLPRQLIHIIRMLGLNNIFFALIIAQNHYLHYYADFGAGFGSSSHPSDKMPVGLSESI